MGHAANIKALCWFLHWGSLGGNTINAFGSRLLGLPKEGSSILTELFVVLYYGSLYVIIVVVSGLLSILPQVPKPVSSILGLVLTVVAGIWIAPMGLVGALF